MHHEQRQNCANVDEDKKAGHEERKKRAVQIAEAPVSLADPLHGAERPTTSLFLFSLPLAQFTLRVHSS